MAIGQATSTCKLIKIDHCYLAWGLSMLEKTPEELEVEKMAWHLD
jgi:hypothetical protein